MPSPTKNQIKNSLLLVFSGLVLSILLGFISTLIERNQMSNLIFGGCLQTTYNLGWPLSFFTVVTECFTCCQNYTGYPIYKFYFVFFVLDLAICTLLAWGFYKVIKKIRKT